MMNYYDDQHAWPKQRAGEISPRGEIDGMSCEVSSSPDAHDEYAREQALLRMKFLMMSLPSMLQTAEGTDMRADPMMLLRPENSQLSEQKRTVVIDWLSEVVDEWRLRNETLHTGAALFDLYLSRCPDVVCRADVQLLGITALNTAIKMQGDSPPGGQIEVQHLVHITADSYSAEEFLRKEVDMISTLQWNLLPPIAPQFIDVLSQLYDLGQYSEYISLHANYLSEVTLLRASFSSVSKVAVGVCCVAISTFVVAKQSLNACTHTHNDFWDQWANAVRASGGEPPDLRCIGEAVLAAWSSMEHCFQQFQAQGAQSASRATTRRRYTDPEFCSVANYPLPTQEELGCVYSILSELQKLLQPAAEPETTTRKQRGRRGKGNRKR
eukprot:Hpha_TRINITY_DN16512_c1_g1::TRINITY_DN16512_c1_g1_i1::g.134689::m.134689/K06627/CCNA; cyclin-A